MQSYKKPLLPLTHVSSDGLEQQTTSQPVRKFNWRLPLAAFVIYAISDACWQAADDALGNDAFVEGREYKWLPLFYIARYFATGAAQAVGGYAATYLLSSSCLNISDCWDRWQTGNSLTLGVLWQAQVDAGKYFGGGLTIEGDPYTLTRSVACSTALILGGFAAQASYRKFKQCVRKNPSEEKTKNNTFSDVGDVTSSWFFWFQGKSDQFSSYKFGSPAGQRNVAWAALFSGTAIAAVEIARETWNYLRPRCGRRPTADQ